MMFAFGEAENNFDNFADIFSSESSKLVSRAPSQEKADFSILQETVFYYFKILFDSLLTCFNE